MRSAISLSGRPAIFRLAQGEMAANFVDGGTRFGEREPGEISDRKTGDFYGETFGPQSALVASRAGCRRHVLGKPVAIRIGIRFFQAFFEMRQHTLEVKPLDAGAIGWIAVQNQVLHFQRKLFEGRLEIESVRGGREFHRPLHERGTRSRP